MNISKQLKKAVRDSGMSLYAIAKGADMEYSTLHRFAAGQRDIYLETAAKLAKFFGLELCPVVPPKKGRAKK